MTVADLITLALKDIGVIAKTQVPSADELADAFTTLNQMLNSWQVERLLIYENRRSVFPLTGGVQTYTIGAGGAFNIPRPVWIQDAGLVNTGVTPNFELPIRMLTIDEFAALTIKAQSATQSWYLYNDYAFPLSTLTFWPVPSVSALSVALYIPTPVTQFANTAATVSLPPGYEEALRWNLAVRCCPMFGRQIDPVVAGMANNALTIIQRANKRLDTLGVDPALIGGSDRGIFNYLTGESTGMRNT